MKASQRPFVVPQGPETSAAVGDVAMGALERATAALVRWVKDCACPLWSKTGLDSDHRRFEERLSLDGSRLPDVPIRLLSQARQIYVYALAAKREWHPGASTLIEQAYSSMVRDYHGRDGVGGWVFSIHRDGRVADARRDFYAHAFVLLAIASYVGATGESTELDRADETLAFIDRHMADPEQRGFLEEFPPTDALRRQNPHMHLFESLLALWECSGNAHYLERAGRLFDLFASRFFRSDFGVVCEHFSAKLEPAPGLAGSLVEPGHHYEWVWLLRRFERAGGHPVQNFVDPLYRHAHRHGHDRDGLIVDELLVDGRHHMRSRRTWPIAEAIKANIVEAELGREGAVARAAALSEALMRHFLLPAPRGGWIDRLDESGNPATDFMPASTFYHVASAIDELDRFVTRRTQPESHAI